MNLHEIARNELRLLLDFCRQDFSSSWEWRLEGNTISFRTARNDNWSPLSQDDINYYGPLSQRWNDEGRPDRRHG